MEEGKEQRILLVSTEGTRIPIQKKYALQSKTIVNMMELFKDEAVIEVSVPCNASQLTQLMFVLEDTTRKVVMHRSSIIALVNAANYLEAEALLTLMIVSLLLYLTENVPFEQWWSVVSDALPNELLIKLMSIGNWDISIIANAMSRVLKSASKGSFTSFSCFRPKIEPAEIDFLKICQYIESSIVINVQKSWDFVVKHQDLFRNIRKLEFENASLSLHKLPLVIESMSHLIKLHLRSVTLHSRENQNQFCQVVAHLAPRLESLQLVEFNVHMLNADCKKQFFSALSQMKYLKMLHLERNHLGSIDQQGVINDFYAALGNMTALVSLKLQENELGGNTVQSMDLTELFHSMKQLRHLIVLSLKGNCLGLCSNGLSALWSLFRSDGYQQLQILDLAGNCLNLLNETQAMWSSISTLKLLSLLSVPQNYFILETAEVDAMIDSLSCLDKLDSLNIAGTKFKFSDQVQFNRWCTVLAGLDLLYFSVSECYLNRNIDNVDVNHDLILDMNPFFIALQSMSKLKLINLGGNFLFDVRDITEFAKAVSNWTELETLSVYANDMFKCPDIAPFCMALRKLKKLKEIDLRYNGLDSERSDHDLLLCTIKSIGVETVVYDGEENPTIAV